DVVPASLCHCIARTPRATTRMPSRPPFDSLASFPRQVLLVSSPRCRRTPMKSLGRLVFVLVALLLVSFPVHARDKKTDSDKAKEPDKETIQGFKKLGAEYKKRDGLPGFEFLKCDDLLLTRLPRVDVPFGLALGGTQVSDDGLKHLTGLKQLRALEL